MTTVENMAEKTIETCYGKEDVDLFLNTLNAEAGRFLYSDQYLHKVLLRAQAIISALISEKSEGL